MKKPTSKSNKALIEFMGKIDSARRMLAAIETHLDDHFGVSPEEVNWAHAGDAGRLVEKLEEITETFHLSKK